MRDKDRMTIGVSYHALLAGDTPSIYFTVSRDTWFMLFVAHPQQKWWVHFKERPVWAFKMTDGSQTVELDIVDDCPYISYSNDVTGSMFSARLSVRGAFRMHQTLLNTPDVSWL